MEFSKNKASRFKKHGVEMWKYCGKENLENAGVLYLEVDGGHFEEFYHEKSAFIYYVIEGNGDFYLDGKKIPVVATDLIVVPPQTKIYYLGKMKLLLVTAPAWEEEYEHHVRDISN